MASKNDLSALKVEPKNTLEKLQQATNQTQSQPSTKTAPPAKA